MTSLQKTSIFLGAAFFLVFLFYSHYFSKKQPIRVADESVLMVGTAAEFPPFEFIKNDEIVGFDIDLIKEVAQRLEKKLVLKDMPFTTLIPQLQNGSLHILAAGLTPTPERARVMLFTKPYLETDSLVVITLAKNPKISSLDDLKGKTVIVNEGFNAERYMSARAEGIDLKRLPTVADAFLSLTSGRADAFVVAANNVKPFFKHYSAADFSLFTIPDTNEQTAFAVSKKYPELLEKVQKVLDDLRHEGFIEQLQKKWEIS